MRAFIIRLINLGVLLLSMALFAKDPSIPLFIPVLVLIGTLVEQERRLSFCTLSQHDRQLIQKFRTLFPPDSATIAFLREHDIGNPYPCTSTDPILQLHDEWKGVDYEFDDKKLEKGKKQLLASVRDFVKVLVIETSPHDVNPRLMTMDYEDPWKDPEKEKAREKLNNLATEVLAQHEAFVRIIRLKTRETEQGNG